MWEYFSTELADSCRSFPQEILVIFTAFAQHFAVFPGLAQYLVVFFLDKHIFLS